MWRVHEESNWDPENKVSEGAKIQNMLRCFRFELLSFTNEGDVCGAVNSSDMHAYPCQEDRPFLTSREAEVLFQVVVFRLNEAVPESPVMYFCLNCRSPQRTTRRTFLCFSALPW